MKKSQIYVKVENKKQAKQYKTILKALGEEVSGRYWVDYTAVTQDVLVFIDNRWTVAFDTYNKTEVSIKELIKILVNEEA